MKSRISFFNFTVLKKDITRFAPVWALYTIGAALCLLMIGSGDTAGVAADIAEMTSVMAPINFVYALICAMLLFGDLFVPRMCNALHAMPLRREGWFLTHTAAGLLFCLIPNAVICGAAALLLGRFASVALLWLAVTVLEFLFFFTTAVFAAMCAGSRLATAVVYGILHFASVLIYFLIEILYLPVMYGIRLNQTAFTRFSPVVRLTGERFVLFEVDRPKNTFEITELPQEVWCYAGICAAVGLVLFVLALLIYRRRHLETAGDFISLKPVAPVFLVVYTLLCGAFLYLVADVFADELEYVFLAVGIAVGFFTGRMLLERTVKVFRPGTFLRLAVLAAVLAGSILTVSLDPFGRTAYVPAPEDVEAVTVGSPVYRRDRDYTFTEESAIRTVTQAHTLLREKPDDGAYSPLEVSFTYSLSGGKTLTRCYRVPTGSEAEETLQPLLSSAEYLFMTDHYEDFVRDLQAVNLYYYKDDEPMDLRFQNRAVPVSDYGEALTEENGFLISGKGEIYLGREALQALMAAVKADCDAGNLAQDTKHDGAIGELNAESGDYEYFYLTIYTECTHITAYLDSLIAAIQPA